MAELLEVLHLRPDVAHLLRLIEATPETKQPAVITALTEYFSGAASWDHTEKTLAAILEK